MIPAYDAARTVGAVVRGLHAGASAEHGPHAVLVVDDGSSDGTAEAAAAAGAEVLRHPTNRGKGAALATGLRRAAEIGARVAVTLDADGQHPAEEALRLLADAAPEQSLVIGVRDLAAAGAPRANRISNGISNFFLSLFVRQRLRDTQCGLRRYPVTATLALGVVDQGYAFESEVLLRARRAAMPIVERPIRVVYPALDGTTHFDAVRDPARIVRRVVATLLGPARR